MDVDRENLDSRIKGKLIELARQLVSQQNARVLIDPYKGARGFWFGAGQMLKDEDGTFILVGRYRNFGDSRTGLLAGERGLELAVFKSDSFFADFEKTHSFSKSDLECAGRQVTSIEGVSLLRNKKDCELFISSEKACQYPHSVAEYQKPGTGVWSIDAIRATNIDGLGVSGIHEVLSSQEPAILHVKDPVVFAMNDTTVMMYCIHPYSWSSTDTGLAVRRRGEETFRGVNNSVLPRGPVWDVAATRVTDHLALPNKGILKDLPRISLYFYDGAECLRQHDENPKGAKWPRGYSCEEIGGLAWGFDHEFPRIQRLTLNFPLFISPCGTGCSRYVSTLSTDDAIYATWQQSQDDYSQPLVGHKLAMEEVERILTGEMYAEST